MESSRILRLNRIPRSFVSSPKFRLCWYEAARQAVEAGDHKVSASPAKESCAGCPVCKQESRGDARDWAAKDKDKVPECRPRYLDGSKLSADKAAAPSSLVELPRGYLPSFEIDRAHPNGHDFEATQKRSNCMAEFMDQNSGGAVETDLCHEQGDMYIWIQVAGGTHTSW